MIIFHDKYKMMLCEDWLPIFSTAVCPEGIAVPEG